MACRVGMSTDPETRINYWRQVEGHTQGSVIAQHLTYNEALEREQLEANRRGCRYYGGGQYVAGRVWSVYHVSGGR